MKQQPTPQQMSNRGQEAQALLENELFNQVWQDMRAEAMEAWAAMDLRDTEGQRLGLQRVKVIDRLRATFVSMVQAGEAADSLLKKAMRERDLVAEGKGAQIVRRAFGGG